MNKTNGKFVAAVIAILMIVCAVAVVAMPSADAVDAKPTADFTGVKTVEVDEITDLTADIGYTASTGVLMVSSDLVLNISGTVGSAASPAIKQIILNGGNLQIQGTGTIYIANDADNGSTIIFGKANGVLSITGGVTVNLDSKGDNSFTINNGDVDAIAQGLTAFNTALLSVTNGATLNVMHAGSGNSTWYNADYQNGSETYLDVNGATVNFSKATSVQGVVLTATNNAKVIVDQSRSSGIVLKAGSIIENSSLKSTAAYAGILVKGDVTLTNSSITAETSSKTYSGIEFSVAGTDIGTGESAPGITLDSESSVTSDTYGFCVEYGATASGSSFGATIDGDGTVAGTFNGIRNGTGTTTYTLDGVSLDDVTAGAGINVTIGSNGVLAEGIVNFTGATVETTGTIYKASGASISGITSGVYDPASGEPASAANFGALKNAIASGAEEVNVTSNITVDEDYTIPQNVTVKLNGGLTVTVSNGVTLSGAFTYDEEYNIAGEIQTTAIVSVTVNITTVGTGAGVIFTNPNGTNGATIGIVGSLKSATTLGADDLSSYSTTINDISIDGDASKANINISRCSVGNLTLSTPINLTGDAEVPYGCVLTFAQGGKITVPSGVTLTVYGELKYSGITVNRTQITGEGTVRAIDVAAVQPYCSMDVLGVGDKTITQANDLKNVIPGSTVIFDNKYAASSYLTGNVTLTNVTIYLNGFDLNIGAQPGVDGTVASENRGTLTLDNCTVYRGADSTHKMTKADGSAIENSVVVNAYSAFSIVNSKVFATVEQANERASITASNPNVTYDNIASEAMVGYGTQLTLTGDLSSSMDVFGTLVINSAVTVPYGSSLNVYSGASLEVNGTLTVQGTANFYQGSTAQIDGTVTVGRTQGGSALNIGELEAGSTTSETKFTVGAEGAVTISGTSSGYAAANVLDVYSGADFAVEGTLTMSGSLSGSVQDKGTITFNGSSTDGEIVVYDGVTLTIASVTTTAANDSLSITDAGVSDESTDNRNNRDSSDGNTVTLRNVRNVTVNEAVEVIRWTVNGTNHVDYRSIMTVTGTITTVDTDADASIRLSGNGIYGDAIAGVGVKNDQYAYMIVGDVTLGEGVDLTVDDTIKVTVTGQVNALAEDIKIVNNGEITVTGQIAVQNATGTSFTNANILNATTYYITDAEGDRTDYYTGFNAAVTAGPDSDNDTITVMGTVQATETITIPNGLRVEMQSGSQITVNEDVVLTLADGAKMNGPSATVEVEGTFTAEDYAEDLTVRNVNADVMSTNGASRTWTSLANAIESGMTDITLNRVIVIDSDLTIPEGVTVTTNIAPVTDTVDGAEYNYSILIDDAKLTIDGTLAMNETSEGAIAMTSGENKDSEIEVNGVFSARLLDDTYDRMDNEAGAHFAIVSGAFTTFYVSNVEFAAQTASNNINLDGAVEIKGIVSAGDVTFTAVQDGEMTVNVMPLETPGATDAEKMTILTMGTMTMAGNVNFSIADNARVSGSVSALCGDGTTNAVVDLDAVEGTMHIQSAVSETADANEYDVYVAGNYDGDVTVSAGTVSVGVVGTSFVYVDADATFTVASGAAVVVPDNASITSATPTDKIPSAVTIDGTITIQDTDALKNGVYTVNGAIVTDGVNMDIDADVTLRVTGTMTIDADQYLNVNGGQLIVGDRPTVLGQAASGTVNGAVQIASGYILAYAGTDMSGAQIDINAATGESDSAVTEYFINEESYATIYAVERNADVDIEVINKADDDILLNGLATNEYWFETAQDANAYYVTTSTSTTYPAEPDNDVNTHSVGDYDAVYAYYGPAYISGTLSIGQGMTMYVDGLVVDPFEVAFNGGYELAVGTHTVSISANAGYSIENAAITFNGQTVSNGGTIEVTADMNTFTLAASGATPADTTVVVNGGSGDDGLGLTDILLIILVILIVVMAIIVALRLMRS